MEVQGGKVCKKRKNFSAEELNGADEVRELQKKVCQLIKEIEKLKYERQNLLLEKFDLTKKICEVQSTSETIGQERDSEAKVIENLEKCKAFIAGKIDALKFVLELINRECTETDRQENEHGN